MVGERDAKFVAIGTRMVEMIDGAELLVIPGGHGLPLENPAEVAGVLAGRSPSDG